MLQSFFISAHPAGNCQLILGESSAILLDCTVSFCAPETVDNIKTLINNRPLDAIILSHSHYDHAAGLPWLRRAFPETPIYAHPYVREVFSKPTALATIHKMCQNAQRLYGTGFTGGHFDDAELQVITPLFDGQELPFDNGVLRILFTPGHTKDSLSVDFPDENTTWLCETLGVPRPDGRVQPCFLSGYQATLDSVSRIASLGKRQFILSHTQAPLSIEQSADYLTESRAAITQSAALIRRLFDEGRDYAGIFEGYAEQYWNELYRPIWPYEAFSINTAAAIKVVLRELCGQEL
ncbi:MBL fold metallo-hydrolase [Oscillospiraceae bacterium LTW-04]|nr:MBL fold metallo-hydrolase [Oscillospiraceae bacterium MB24-C1]